MADGIQVMLRFQKVPTDFYMNQHDAFRLLSQLTLGGSEISAPCYASRCEEQAKIGGTLGNLTERGWSEFESLASANHVIVRAFRAIRVRMASENYSPCTAWAEHAIEAEQARISYALSCLEPICEALEDAGRVTVIKSLDHWPDLGNDLDLYTDAEAPAVVAIMRSRFNARVERQSWGDRMANKWNFIVPGLPEPVEVHVGRLGQMGEQNLIGKSVTASAGGAKFGTHSFRVPSAEDRILISTLQRMYRHFYIRLCDVLDIARLIEEDLVDYDYLRSLAQLAGIWEGVATYLKIVNEYVKEFRGAGLALPAYITSAARFGMEQVHFARNFLRVRVLPHCAQLYAAELSRLLWNGEIVSTLRLSLMPALATAAALKHKLTDSDKGIW